MMKMLVIPHVQTNHYKWTPDLLHNFFLMFQITSPHWSMMSIDLSVQHTTTERWLKTPHSFIGSIRAITYPVTNPWQKYFRGTFFTRKNFTLNQEVWACGCVWFVFAIRTVAIIIIKWCGNFGSKSIETVYSFQCVTMRQWWDLRATYMASPVRNMAIVIKATSKPSKRKEEEKKKRETQD